MNNHYVRVYKKEWERKSSQSERGYLEGFFVEVCCDLVGGHKRSAWFADRKDAIMYVQSKAYYDGMGVHNDLPIEDDGKKKRGKK